MTSITAPAGQALTEPARRVHPRARVLWAVSETIEGVLVTGGLAALNYWLWPQAAWGWWVVGVIGALSLASIIAVPLLRWRVHRWEVSADAVITRVGWWSIEHRVAPMSRVQTVDLRRGPLEQLFSLASVTVTTASHAGPVVVGPVDLPTAHHLVERITAAAGTQDAT